MRVHKTDRGYIDLDHVLAVGEPYYYKQGLYGFDVTLAFQDNPKQMLYEDRELGLMTHLHPQGNSEECILHDLRLKKLEPFVAAWKGEA